MTVTFAGITLPRCQEEAPGYDVRLGENLLMTGELSIQPSTIYGYNPTFKCVGTATERDSLLAVIGSVGTLIINTSSHASMYIKSFGPAQAVPMSSYYTFQISFIRGSS
jgi:hypothetical protein